MNSYWLSWYHPSRQGFDLHWPWWVSGERGIDGYLTICAAVQADNEDAAKAFVLDAMDEPITLEWRFCKEKPDGWIPFNDRFPRADWMVWVVGKTFRNT